MTTTTLDVRPKAITTGGLSRLLAPVGGLGLVIGLITLFLSPAGDDCRTLHRPA